MFALRIEVSGVGVDIHDAEVVGEDEDDIGPRLGEDPGREGEERSKEKKLHRI